VGETLKNGIHLAVLTALAFAEPLFDVLGHNPTFFVVRGSTSGEIVLFAVVLTLVPPVLLLIAELGARAVSPNLARGVHVVFIGALAALLALYVFTETDALTGVVAVAAATAAGAIAAVLYARASALRTFLTVLAPAPLVFLALFLLHSPVSKLVFADEPEARAATVPARTPVVLIILDEVNTGSLMDREQQIDARRFPNFGALARDATWFRNATTVYWLSEGAVPSILTGNLPSPDRVPIASEYPRSLFTLLGRSYRMHVIETVTDLCPASLCRSTPGVQAHAVSPASSTLASDAGIVYLHLLLPKPYVGHVAPIDDSWGNFGRRGQEEANPAPKAIAGQELEPCARNVCLFANGITDDPKPTLHLIDVQLPHVPYVYLPSGRRYAIDARILRGIDEGHWLEAWPMLQGYQRYLLQLGYTDAALGLMLRRLRETGLYDRALVIVTADHGVGFRLDDQRRLPTATNLDEIAFVPLFVKLPAQRHGRISDAYVRSIDILPTIARVLRIPLPWPVDGRPLVGRRLPNDGTVTVFKSARAANSAPLSTLRARRARALREHVAAFGTGPFARVYRVGPHAELLGRDVGEFPVRAASGVKVRIDGRPLLDAVDRSSGFLPSFLEGRLIGGSGRSALAVGVNGRIAAVTYSFREGNKRRFSALLPEEALREGRNTIDVFLVHGSGRALQLERLAGSDLSFTLRERGGDITIAAASGTIAVKPGLLSGTVQATQSDKGFVFKGRVVDPRNKARVDLLVVFAGGRAVYVTAPENVKPDSILGQHDLGRYGFEFELPRALLPAPPGGDVRVFAIHGRLASELRYGGAYPWRRG
jgi:hypothetical protein